MKPEMHEMITQFTINHFAAQLPESIKKYADQIIKGTVAEDDPTRERAKNWHFYRRDGSPIPEITALLKVRRTSEHIVSERIEAFKNAPDMSLKFENLGRILHHIQDMSTPSHVLPIYHDMFIHDHYESFMTFSKTMNALKPVIPPLHQKSNETFLSIYKDAAEDTLCFLDEYKINVTVNGQIKELKSDLFWEDGMGKKKLFLKGFGRYGKLHKMFKEKNLSKPFSVGSDTYGIHIQELYRLNNAICGKAIADTCRALMHVT